MEPLSQNLYTYAENNPVNYDDPSGHIANSWTKSLENTVKKFCTTANRGKSSAVGFVKNVDWGKVASGALAVGTTAQQQGQACFSERQMP